MGELRRTLDPRVDLHLTRPPGARAAAVGGKVIHKASPNLGQCATHSINRRGDVLTGTAVDMRTGVRNAGSQTMECPNVKDRLSNGKHKR